MNVTVRKIGNSEGVILPKEVLERLNLKSGDSLILVEDAEGVRLHRPVDDPAELERRMNIARERMKKYEKTYRALAK